MIVSIHQPAYLPWLGYFDKIIRSDVFVFLDTVQFEKNSFINRNKIKTAQGDLWLTIPVLSKGHIGGTLRDTEIDATKNWPQKHLGSISANYRKAAFYGRLFPQLELEYQKKHHLLSDLCYTQLLFWLRYMGIDKRIIRSSTLEIDSQKSDLVLDICKHFNASTYISGAQGRDYLDQSAFAAAGIGVEFQDYVHPTYPQLHGEFLPYMSVLDLCMNSDNFGIISGVRP